MAEPRGLLNKAEASLTDPFLTPGEARARLESWLGLGVRRVFTYPWLLGELEVEGREGVTWIGAVGFPAGGATLSTKRMELLECVRLGAQAATVVLTPGYVIGGKLDALQKEATALLATARELQVRFLVEPQRLDERALTLLARVLREAKPFAVVSGSGFLDPAPGPEAVRRLRAHLPRKVHVIAGGDAANPAGARALLAAGAEGFLTSHPEAFSAGDA